MIVPHFMNMIKYQIQSTIEYALEEIAKNGSSLGLRKLAKEILSNKKSL